jgi:DNA-binding NtrC family response regulator
VIERAAIIAHEGSIRMEHLPPGFGHHEPAGKSAADASAPARGEAQAAFATASPEGGLHLPVGSTIEQAERALIELTLEHTRNNKTRAADILGISQKTLFNKLREYGAADGPPA